jgi:hypothetical protein
MSIPEETQKEISELYQSVARYFASSGLSEDYYKNSNNNLNELQQTLADKLPKEREKRATLTETFIDDLNQQIEYKESEIEMLKDQLTSYDLKIDQYDVIINNIDKEIIPLIAEINVGIASVKTAYDNRIAAGCKSDLYWELIGTVRYSFSFKSSGAESIFEIPIYECKKNPNVRIDYSYYGAKYYRKPQNQDYGANIVTEFTGTIGAGKTILGVVGASSTLRFQIGDKVLDNIDNPVVFSANNIPTILSFGTTSLVGATTSFGGTISFGSTIIAHTGIGTTTDISVGDVINLTNVLPINTKVVGFGTTTVELTDVWDPDANGAASGGYITTSGTTNSLIISVASIGSTTNGNFNVGLLTSYPAVILDTPALQDAENINFTLVRDAQTIPTEFDYTNNPIDPVTIGIMGNFSTGLGHKLTLVNNGSPVGPFQWHEVRGPEFAPEPACGAGFARYYEGNNSWPAFISYVRNPAGGIISSTTTYVPEGYRTTNFGFGGLFPGLEISTVSISSLDPSVSTCNALTNIITAEESSRDAIIAKNISKIQNLIASASALRDLRDKLEGQAFSILQGRIHADVELNKLKQNLTALNATDFTPYEPKSYYFNPDTGKTSTSTVGVATS